MQPHKRTPGVKLWPLPKQGTGHRSVPSKGASAGPCGLGLALTKDLSARWRAVLHDRTIHIEEPKSFAGKRL